MSCRGNICSSAWNTYCPPFFIDLGFCRVSHFSHSSLSQLLCSIFHPFLNTSSQRHHLLHWVAQLWPTVGLFYSWLEPAVFSPRWDWRWGGGAARVSHPRGHLCSHPHLLTLPWKCNTQCKTPTACTDQHPPLQGVQPLQVANQECFPNTIKKKITLLFCSAPRTNTYDTSKFKA